jgi:hypothetical protein
VRIGLSSRAQLTLVVTALLHEVEKIDVGITLYHTHPETICNRAEILILILGKTRLEAHALPNEHCNHCYDNYDNERDRHAGHFCPNTALASTELLERFSQ